jgi:putative Holliday junction resolvase
MPDSGTVLGFDYGERRIGVAIGQRITGTATPLTTLTSKNQNPDWEAIGQLIREWQPEALVVGMPYHLDGSETVLSERIRRFCRQLEGRFRLPVYQIDERLSSAEAERYLKHQRQQGRKSRIDKREIDQLAAAIQLENWLAGESNDSISS